jgi:ELWxxDGT repeat protein
MYMKKDLLNKRKFFAAFQIKFTLTAAFVLVLSFVQAQVSLVKDINWRNEEVYAGEFQSMMRFQNNLYFFFRNELWKSDGTDDGTVLLKTFNQTSSLTVAGSVLFFAADSDSSGYELWKTNGTAEGTVMVKDIYPGPSASGISQLTEFNGQLFFTANNGVTGVELWKSDGTGSGTVLVKDILRVAGSSKPQNLVTMNGFLYFRANNGMNGYELWKTDGSASGTTMVVDIYPVDKKGSNPEQIVNANGTLYFFANNGIDGKQLWKSNGNTGNATQVKIIQPGGTPNLDHLTAVGSVVCFQANDSIHGAEIWRSDGTGAGTYLMADITPGPGSDTEYATPHLNNFKTVNGKLYFLAMENGVGLWTSDGTPAGTVQLTNYYEVNFSWISHNCSSFNNEVYFAGEDWEVGGLALWKTDGTRANTRKIKGALGDGYDSNPMFTELNGELFFIGKSEIWKTDGTEEGTVIVRLMGPPPSSMPLELTDVNGTLFFSATDNQYGGHTLWKSDGTDAGTTMVKEYIYWIKELSNINGSIYFSGRDYRGDELWTSDGTSAGTSLVKNIATDPYYPPFNSNPAEFTELNGQVVFVATMSDRNPYLWTTDGTDAGTQYIEGAQIGEEKFGMPRDLTKSGDKIFFAAQSGLGSELWVTDGITTSLTRDIKLHYRGSEPIQLTAFNNMVYFQADNAGNGYELWKSDGTAAGTTMVKDFRTNDLGSGETLAPIDMGNMMVMNGSLYLTALRATGKNALWKSDGTGTGTRVIKEFAGQPESDIIAALGNQLIFTLSYGAYTEIWKSDGTAAGTVLVESISEMLSVFKPYVVASTDDVVYFLGNTATTQKIWRTDGSATGTYDIVFNGHPKDLEISGSKVYLSATTEKYGWELFTINETVSSGRIQMASTVEPVEVKNEVSVSSYPNPFRANFSLRVQGKESEIFKMKVLTMSGAQVEEAELSCNTDHVIGENWTSGLYFIQINTADNRFVQKVIKSNQ